MTLAAAVLHDTLEDTDTTAEELEREFGIEVRRIVEEVTDDKALPKDMRKRLQVEHTPHASAKAKLVKLADKICNIIDVTHDPPAHWDRERRLGYLGWSELVVSGCRGPNAALEQYFDRVVAEGRGALNESNSERRSGMPRHQVRPDAMHHPASRRSELAPLVKQPNPRTTREPVPIPRTPGNTPSPASPRCRAIR